MGLFTKPVSTGEVLLFIDSISQQDTSVSGPLTDRIWKTWNKSSLAIIDALLIFAGSLAKRPEAQSPEWSAREYAYILESDLPNVIQAKFDLVDAYFGSPDPDTAAQVVSRRQGQDPGLSAEDRAGILFSLCLSAGRIARDLGFDIQFKYG